MRCAACFLICLATLVGLAAGPAAGADVARPDTTWVTTFNRDFYNWATPHVQTFQFPAAGNSYSQVLLYYSITCPESPGDCDPWDRLGYLRLVEEQPDLTTTYYEIARIVTPYDITGPNYPGVCSWVFDVTDYRFLLHDEVTLSNYIETWIGGDRGWIVTIRFAFVSGTNPLEAYQVINLYTSDRLVYGDPDNPIESYLPPLMVDIDPGAEAAKVRAIVTGHGQGNTDNAAEFSYKWHKWIVNGQEYEHYLWRSDCNQNPCRPQGGTWSYSRAGWCPGDKVTPWDNDISDVATPGTTIEINYDIQPYVNLCRPNNPDCVNGITCADCNYNSTGHTEPNYNVNTQLILYRSAMTGVDQGSGDSPDHLQLGQNQPNPFNPATTFYYTLEEPSDVTISIYSLDGKLLKQHSLPGHAVGSFRYTWNGEDAKGNPMPSGVYFYEVKTGAERTAKKMVLLR